MNNVSVKINNMTIKQRTDGRYEGRITNNGKRKSFYGRTQSEVKNKAKEFLTKIENGYRVPSNIIFNDYIEYWLKNYKWNKIEKSSYTRLYKTYKYHIKDTIGKKKIGDITTKDIQNLIDEYANPKNPDIKPLALSGLKKIVQLIRPCMEIAIQEEVLYKNPCKNIIYPKEKFLKVKTKKQFSLDDTEIMQIREVALSRYKTTNEYCSRDAFVLLLILNLGLRVGEALALKWEDIDIPNRIVHINKTIQISLDFDDVGYIEEGENVGYKTEISDSTKTSAGMRILHLSDNVLYYLDELREYDRRNHISSEYVACTRLGTMNNARNLQRSLDRLIKKTNINKNVSLHTLRHTFGSKLLRDGVNIAVISGLMGHANITVTYNKYIHSIKEEEAKAMMMCNVC